MQAAIKDVKENVRILTNRTFRAWIRITAQDKGAYERDTYRNIYTIITKETNKTKRSCASYTPGALPTRCKLCTAACRRLGTPSRSRAVGVGAPPARCTSGTQASPKSPDSVWPPSTEKRRQVSALSKNRCTATQHDTDFQTEFSCTFCGQRTASSRVSTGRADTVGQPRRAENGASHIPSLQAQEHGESGTVTASVACK
jgi:hypothetical protein